MSFLAFLKSLFFGEQKLEEKPLLALPGPSGSLKKNEELIEMQKPATKPLPQPNKPLTPATAPTSNIERVVDGALIVDFGAVMQVAGVAKEQQERVAKAEGLLRSLPKESTPEIKRAVVEAAFRAFDVPMDKIVEAATKESDAIRAYLQNGQRQTREARADGAAKIAQLEDQIAEVREAMRVAAEHQKQREVQAAERTEAVLGVLKFFDKDGGIPGPAELDDADMVESVRPVSMLLGAPRE